MMVPEIITQKIIRKERIVIELGCGPNKVVGAIGIDKIQDENVDIIADIENGLPFLPDNSVDELVSKHLLEHIENLDQLIKEIYRVLKPGGIHRAIVPHFSNPYFYSDYTHRRFFGLYTFDYFSDETSKLKRKVPNFYNKIQFHITKRYLRFYSLRPILNLFRRIYSRWVNRSPSAQECYEESWCYHFPCQEIHFEMTKIGY
jgi:predicted SAM-dependent methyltransferase